MIFKSGCLKKAPAIMPGRVSQLENYTMLALPQFLDHRNLENPQTRKMLASKRRLNRAPAKWVRGSNDVRPAGKRWVDAIRVRVHMNNECDRIGSGHRVVWAKLGRKWVFITDGHGCVGKITFAVYNKIFKHFM
jgi:hypothetical protein